METSKPSEEDQDVEITPTNNGRQKDLEAENLELREQLEQERSRRKKSNTDLFETKEKLNRLLQEWEEEKKQYENEIEDLNNTITLQKEENELLRELTETREQEIADAKRTSENLQFQLDCINGDIDEYKEQIREKDDIVSRLRSGQNHKNSFQDFDDHSLGDGWERSPQSDTFRNHSSRSSDKAENFALRSKQNTTSAWHDSQNVKQLEETLQKLQTDKNALRADYLALEDGKFKIESQLRSIRSDFEYEKEKNKKLKNRCSTLEKEKSELESSISSLKQQLQNNQTDNKDTVKRLRQRVSELEKHIDRTSREKLDATHDKQHLSITVKNMENALRQFTKIDPARQGSVASLHDCATATAEKLIHRFHGVSEDISSAVREGEKRVEFFQGVPAAMDQLSEYVQRIFKHEQRVSYSPGTLKQSDTVSEAGSQLIQVSKWLLRTHKTENEQWKSILSHILNEHWKLKQQFHQKHIGEKAALQQRIQKLECDLHDAAEYGAFVRKQNQRLEEQVAAISEAASLNSSSQEQAQRVSASLQEYRNEIERLKQSISSLQEHYNKGVSANQNQLGSQSSGGTNTSIRILKDTIKDQKNEIVSLRQRLQQEANLSKRLNEQLSNSQQQLKLMKEKRNNQLISKSQRDSNDLLSYAADLALLCEEDSVGFELCKRLLHLLEKRASGDDDMTPSDAEINLEDDVQGLTEHVISLEKSFAILQKQCANIVQDYLQLSDQKC